MNSNQVVIPRNHIQDLLKQIADVYTEFLNFIENELREHPDADPLDRLVQQLREDGLLGWAQLYTDPQNQRKSVLLSAFPPDVLNPMLTAINAMPPDQQTAWLHRYFTEGQEALRSVVEMESRDIETIWSDAVSSPIGAQWLRSRHSFVMATLFDILAAMQTSKSIYQLVAEALEGNPDSFLKAVQIDKTVLEFIPYFTERNRRAADDGDINFLRRLHDHRTKSITVTRLRNVRLWLVLYTLDSMNLLDQFEEDIDSFERLCREIRVYGAHPNVEWFGENDFEARLKDYRRIRRQLVPRTRSNILVKNVSSSNSDS